MIGARAFAAAEHQRPQPLAVRALNPGANAEMASRAEIIDAQHVLVGQLDQPI